MYPLLADESTSAYARTLAKRKLLRLSGVSESEISQLLPPDVHELEALQDLELINHNILPPLRQIDAPHEIYLSVYAQALDTSAKLAAIEMRKQAILDRAAQPQATALSSEASENSAKNVATSIALSNVLKKEEGVISR